VTGHDIIVIGASAGGVSALAQLARQLPVHFPAAVFITIHIPARTPSMLPNILNYAGLLTALHPDDRAEIATGHIYVAPSDHHLLVMQGCIRVVKGPKENRHRPSIDVLFRSAALAYGPRVVGVVLTGSLDDGAAGLLAIHQCGGISVVQDPKDALYPSMPQSALELVDTDYCLPLAKIGPLLTRLAHEQVDAPLSPIMPKDLEKEVRIAAMETDTLSKNEQVGNPSMLSCPECGGVLWELQDGTLLRFRCRVGHAFSADNVLAEQGEIVERALWVALKTLDEKVELSRRVAEQARKSGSEWLVQVFERRIQEAVKSAEAIRSLLC